MTPSNIAPTAAKAATWPPIEKIINMSHEKGAYVLIDGAQSAAHFNIDLQKLNVDFFTASAHKLCGPTGVGFLYGKKELLQLIDI